LTWKGFTNDLIEHHVDGDGLNASSAAALAGTAAIGMGVRFAAGMEQAQQGFTTMLGSAQRARPNPPSAAPPTGGRCAAASGRLHSRD
jgi:hypothetical protein